MMWATDESLWIFTILTMVVHLVQFSQGTVHFEPIGGIQYPPDIVAAVAIPEEMTMVGLELGRLVSDSGDAIQLSSPVEYLVSIDGTGMLILNKTMDHETLCPDPIDLELSCKFPISIYEGISLQTIHLYLLDSQDHRPEVFNVTDCLISFPENTPLKTICRFNVRDGDRWVDRDSLFINFWSQSPESIFQITSDSGVLNLIPGAMADYEKSPVYSITLKIMDSRPGNSGSYSHSFQIEDLPDMPPVFQAFSQSTMNISEELEMGDEILTCVAWDGDRGINDDIEFSFYVSDLDNSQGIPYFALDKSTGKLTVNADLDTDEILRRRGSLIFDLIVMATEVHEPKYGVSQSVSLTVTDGDKHQPRFEDGNLTKNFDLVHPKHEAGVLLSFSIMDSDTDLAHNEYRAQLVQTNLPWLTDAIELSPLVGSGRTVFELKIIDPDKINYDTTKKSASTVNFKVKIVATANPLIFVEANIFLTMTEGDDSTSMYVSITAGLLALSALALLAVNFKSTLRTGLDKMAHKIQNALPKFKRVPKPPAAEFSMNPVKTVQWRGWDVSKILVYDRKHEIPLGKFKLDEKNVLGEGAFGVVSKAYIGNEMVAAKTTRESIPNSPALEALMSELKILTYLGKHEHVIEVVGACTKFLNEGQIHVFVQFCPLGDLETFLRQNRQAYLGEQRGQMQQQIQNGGYIQVDVDLYTENVPMATTPTVLDAEEAPMATASGSNDQNVEINISKSGPLWSMQIADGMDYLQRKRVVHADLAARNVLLVSVAQIKITDFGLSRRLNEDKDVDILPWRWMSLETLRDKIFTSQSDVWSYGVTLWEIFSLGEVPYNVPDWCPEFFDDLLNGRRLSQPLCASSEVYHHLLHCWKEMPDDRPSFSELREIFKKLVPMDEPVLSELEKD